MPEPINNGNGTGEGGQSDQAPQNGQGSGTPAPDNGKQDDGGQTPSFEPEKLTQEQINQILEKNPNVWNTDRFKALSADSAELKRLKAEQEKLTNKQLEEEGKFKELNEKLAADNQKLQEQIQTNNINASATSELLKIGVVDLEAALQLLDRSKVEVKEDGSISGVAEAVEALKSSKAYLFNANGTPPSNVGSPAPNNGDSNNDGKPTFKRSQLRDQAFYAANQQAILEAHKDGRIIDDITPQ